MNWSSIASTALVLSACAAPKSNGLFISSSDGGDAGAGEHVDDGGASSCDSASTAGTAGAESSCVRSAGGGGGVAGSGAVGGGAVGSGAGGGTISTGMGGGSRATLAGASNGGTSGNGGGGGNATGGALSKCELLLLQASAMLSGAQTCSTASGEAFCTGYTTNECGCKVPVNNAGAVATEKYVKAREDLRASCSVTCMTPCVEPTSQTCQLIFGLVVGACVAM